MKYGIGIRVTNTTRTQNQVYNKLFNLNLDLFINFLIVITGGIFTSYIDFALKNKQEASGFPAYAKTLKQKRQYIKDYFNFEGILLEFDRIELNEGKRATAKWFANSQWEFLAMNTNKIMLKVHN
jgi:hypothetical protein